MVGTPSIKCLLANNETGDRFLFDSRGAILATLILAITNTIMWVVAAAESFGLDSGQVKEHSYDLSHGLNEKMGRVLAK